MSPQNHAGVVAAVRDIVLASDRLGVTAWRDEVVEAHGHDPRSAYAELFWLPILGPSGLWVYRRLVTMLEATDPIRLDVDEFGLLFGLGHRAGRIAPVVHTIARLGGFGLARPATDGLAVRLRMGWLSRSQVARLPATLQAAEARGRMPRAVAS